MQWQRWSSWQRGDRRWQCTLIETSELSITDVAGELARWARDQCEAHDQCELPLSGCWWK